MQSENKIHRVPPFITAAMVLSYRTILGVWLSAIFTPRPKIARSPPLGTVTEVGSRWACERKIKRQVDSIYSSKRNEARVARIRPRLEVISACSNRIKNKKTWTNNKCNYKRRETRRFCCNITIYSKYMYYYQCRYQRVTRTSNRLSLHEYMWVYI